MLNALNAPHVIDREPAALMSKREAYREGWSIAELISILLRRMKIVAIAVAACVVLTLLYLAAAEPRFTATATLIPDTRRTPPAPNEIIQESLSDPAVVENQIETIRSERIALAVIDKLELWKDPEFVGTGPGIVSRVLSAIGLERSSRGDEREIKRRAAAGSFATMLKVTRVGRSHLAEIAFTAKDAVKAAAIANEVADAYIQDQLNAKFSQAERSTRWMRQRIAELEQEAAAAARAVSEYKARHKLDGEAGAAPAIFREQDELTASLEHAKAETARARERFERAQAALRAEDAKALPDSGFLDSLNDASVVGLRDAYRNTLRATPPKPLEERGREPDDPAIAAVLAEQRNGIWNAVRAAAETARKDLEAARLREAAIVGRINDLAPRVAEMRGHLAALKELEARHQSYRQLHEALQNRYARVSQFAHQQSLPVTEARIVADASPPLKKSSPKALLLLLLAASVGCTVGVGGAFGAEYFDRTIRRPEQIDQHVGVRPLGVVERFAGGNASHRLRWPTLAGERKRAREKAATGADGRLPPKFMSWLSGPAGETLRGVKVAVDGSVRPAGGRVLAVVSPSVGEGKTTVALALAVLIARGGKRTLLIDGDLREPSLTRTLTPDASGGLVFALEQRSPFTDGGLRHELGFSFLGQAPGFTAAHPSDILASDGMQDMLDHLRSRYDWIIVDTPALLAHVDVPAAAGLFDAFVLIAEWGKTTIDDLDRSIVSSGAIADRLVGVLINKAPVSRT